MISLKINLFSLTVFSIHIISALFNAAIFYLMLHVSQSLVKSNARRGKSVHTNVHTVMSVIINISSNEILKLTKVLWFFERLFKNNTEESTTSQSKFNITIRQSHYIMIIIMALITNMF